MKLSCATRTKLAYEQKLMQEDRKARATCALKLYRSLV
jgi:hypothetical protein